MSDPTPAYTAEEIAADYRRMVLIRRFEEALGDLFTENRLGGTSHFCIGQEACAVGVVSAVRDTDYLVSNHRGHGHLLARGLSPMRVFAELMGRRIGYCGGKGGSQHMCALDRHFLGTNGITAGGLPIATGAAFALRYRESDGIVVVFFGDGASNQGTFHESLNMAALWELPVLFVCENNGYGMSIPVSRSSAVPCIAQRAAAYAMPGRTVNGMDLLEVKTAASEQAAYVRENGPALLELTTYRHCGHSKNDARVYRTRDEEAEWQEKDCLRRTARLLETHFGMNTDDVRTLADAADAEIRAAVDEAEASPVGDRDLALGGVYA